MSPSTATGLVDVTMPQMGVSVAEGTLVEWKKQVGDEVARDEIICSISTDKIDTDVESPAAGRLHEILVEVGATVEVGTVMARIATDGGDVPASPGAPSATIQAAAQNEQAKETGTGEATAALTVPGQAGELRGDLNGSAHHNGNQRRRYSPVVQRIAAEHNLDLEQIAGTGRGGRVRKQDVLAFIREGGSTTPEEPPMHIESPYRPEPVAPTKQSGQASGAPASVSTAQPSGPSASGIRESGPLSRMRQSIGHHMLQSIQTSATCTTIIEADLWRVEIARKRDRLTYLPFIARATIETLREFPSLNATLEGETFTTYHDVNLGIAVSLGEGGLMVPVIHQAQNLSVQGLGAAIKEIAQRTRTNQLTPDEVRGGTFTITNPGASGSIMATPVINQPQVAILDTEAVVKRPVVITDEHGNDSIAIRPMTYLCMSWDHRALDGALAAQFLASLRKKLEEWPLTD